MDYFNFVQGGFFAEIDANTTRRNGHELGRPKPGQLLQKYPNADVIVYGHTHRQLIFESNGRVVVNPGAAGARRFDLAPSVAVMTIDGSGVVVELIEIE